MHAVGGDKGSVDRGSVTTARRSSQAGRTAVARFELASVRLAAAGPKGAHAWALDALADHPAAAREVDAGRALVRIAETGDAAALRQLLRADPTCAEPSWTVACYRVGDLSPHCLRDFTDPVGAVRTLVDCGDEDHLAAELVASTPDGLCWVALVRTGAEVRFQLFGSHSVLARPGRHGLTDGERAVVEAAQERWAAVLASWYTAQGAAGPFFEAHLASRAGATGAAPGPGSLPLLPADGLVGSGSDLVGAAVPDAAPPWAPGDGASDVAAQDAADPLGIGQLGHEPSATEVFFAVAATLDDLSRSVADIAEVVERLDRSVGALSNRVDMLARPGASPSPAPASVRAGAVPDAGSPAGEPARPWWAVWRRATRRPPAVGGAAARSL